MSTTLAPASAATADAGASRPHRGLHTRPTCLIAAAASWLRGARYVHDAHAPQAA